MRVFIGFYTLVNVESKSHLTSTLQFFLEAFFNCYLAAPQPSLGHCQGSSLTDPMLILAQLAAVSERSIYFNIVYLGQP